MTNKCLDLRHYSFFTARLVFMRRSSRISRYYGPIYPSDRPDRHRALLAWRQSPYAAKTRSSLRILQTRYNPRQAFIFLRGVRQVLPPGLLRPYHPRPADRLSVSAFLGPGPRIRWQSTYVSTVTSDVSVVGLAPYKASESLDAMPGTSAASSSDVRHLLFPFRHVD